MLDFLQEFLDAHPEVADNEVFVTGESYAGHYVPAVSHRIWQYNQAPTGVPINFKGLAIGAPLAPVLRPRKAV
jgi:serine carboxypeptidase-like clade IV